MLQILLQNLFPYENLLYLKQLLQFVMLLSSVIPAVFLCVKNIIFYSIGPSYTTCLKVSPQAVAIKTSFCCFLHICVKFYPPFSFLIISVKLNLETFYKFIQFVTTIFYVKTAIKATKILQCFHKILARFFNSLFNTSLFGFISYLFPFIKMKF